MVVRSRSKGQVGCSGRTHAQPGLPAPPPLQPGSATLGLQPTIGCRDPGRGSDGGQGHRSEAEQGGAPWAALSATLSVSVVRHAPVCARVGMRESDRHTVQRGRHGVCRTCSPPSESPGPTPSLSPGTPGSGELARLGPQGRRRWGLRNPFMFLLLDPNHLQTRAAWVLLRPGQLFSGGFHCMSI